MAELYPVFMRIEGSDCLVVGGGRISARKVRKLLECGAEVTVVAPEVEKELESLAAEGKITWQAKPFEERDLTGKKLVIVATNIRKINEDVSRAAEKLGIPINVVDVPDLCTFYVPSIVRRGGLQLAISTQGASPLLSRRIREHLEGYLEEKLSVVVDELSDMRERIKESLSRESDRIKFWQDYVDLDYLRGLTRLDSDAEIREKLKQRENECLSRLVD